MRTSTGAARGATRARLTVAALAAVGMTAVLLAPAATAADSLRQLADAKGFDIGFALDPNRLNESQYRQIADSEFNFVVAENAMKWDSTEPNQNQFSWSQADAVVSYAQSTDKGLYGHTLVWHNQLPGWAQSLNGDQLLAAMKNHVSTVAARYAGEVEAWDVVNEAFEDNGSRRQSVFQQRIGDSYIEEAFKAARAADPNAKLCINDYSTDAINAKSTAIYNLVKDFKSRGVPIDCVGFQAHLIVGQVPSDMQQNLQRFADLGVDVRITELDIRMQTPASSWSQQQQARDYAAVIKACGAVDRCQGVTVWGITDKYSWIPDVFSGEGSALLWDNDYQRKSAYDAVAEALASIPARDDSTDPQDPEDPQDPSDPQDPTDPTDPQDPSDPQDPEDPTDPQQPTGDCTVIVRVTNSWPGGFQGEGTVTAGSSALSGWSASFSLDNGAVSQVWNGKVSSSAGAYTVANEHYNGSLAPGASTSFGFLGTGAAPSGITQVSCSAL